MSKRLILFSAIIFILLVVGYLLLSSYSVKFLQSKMQESLGPGISFTQVKATTRYVAGKGIFIEEPQSKLKLLQVDEIRIYPAIRTLLSKSIILNNIVLYQPSIFVYRTNDNFVIGPGPKNTGNKQQQKTEDQAYKIKVDKITTKQGSLLFTDNLGLNPAAKTRLTNIESTIKNIKYPITDSRSPVTLKGKFSDEDESNLKVNGWIGFKNYDAHLDASLTKAEITKFKPYYKKEFGNSVEKGFANISSTTDIRNYIADISGTLKLFDLHVDESEGDQLGVSAREISQIVKDKNNKLDVKFQAKGNLKDPNFNLGKELTESLIADLSKSYGLSLKKQGMDTLKERIEKEKEKIKDKIEKLF